MSTPVIVLGVQVGGGYTGGFKGITGAEFSGIKAAIDSLPETERAANEAKLNNIRGLTEGLESEFKTNPAVAAGKAKMAADELKGLLHNTLSILEKSGINNPVTEELRTIVHKLNNTEAPPKENPSEAPPKENPSEAPPKENPSEKPKENEEARTQEHAKIVSKAGKGKWGLISKVLGSTLIGAGMIGNYLSHNDQKKEREKALEALKKSYNDAKLSGDSAKAKEASDALAHQLRKTLIEDAAQIVKDRENERRKAAEDVGLNLGNFAAIFSPKINRQGLHQAQDMRSLLNLQSNKLNFDNKE
jgi:outer membrane biosynthesis protein TonB